MAALPEERQQNAPIGSSSSVDNPHRLVIFVGPHKSASSSVQEFFSKYASNKHPDQRMPSLENWTWPWNPKRKMYQGRKAFAALVKEKPDSNMIPQVYKSIRDALQSQKEQSIFQIILGTEEFDRFGTTPWSHWNSIDAIRNLIGMVAEEMERLETSATRSRKSLHIDLVVNYRSPRNDHWVSIWKQLTRKLLEKGDQQHEYRNFMCYCKECKKIWEYLDAVANPLGLAEVLLNELSADKGISASKVHIMDMKGIADNGLDISHTIACEVMDASPCPSGWLQVPGETESNISKAILQNQRSGDPGLSSLQLQQIETILRARDCAYKSSLEHFQQQQQLFLHHAEHLWDKCGSEPKYQWNVTNTDDILELLKEQLGCGSGRLSSGIIDSKDSGNVQKSSILTPSDSTVHNINRNVDTNNGFDQIVKVQIAVLVVLQLGLMVWIGRRARCKCLTKTSKQ